ncbi:DUF2500 domain-containing protein [Falsibacillus pallidus]|uniref:Uncharacterized protein DUF2500 n=1 Tax=Falsibacillus pallidus TaxID=493781 RepID=A0A370GQM6_9BACI|nr:DUF2500 domain-containing protein [Falsibacillus pallidus]RDI45801.1 uncharacterized protein DUF2500 [Falsibacillus pallidus]
MPFDNGPSNLIFTLGPIFIGVIFIIVIGGIIFSIIKGISQWSHNNKQPKLTVDAKVVSKRDEVSRHSHNHDGHHHHSTSTNYYATFEVESGDRMEFQVDGSEFGMLAEGDKGTLSFQGTRYLGFERSISKASF